MLPNEKKKIIKEFLNDLDKNGLIEMNQTIWNIELMTNMVDRMEHVPDIFTRLVEMHYSTQEPRINEDELMFFSYVFFIRFFVSAIEYVRWVLISMINYKVIKFSDQTNLGTALRQISSKLKYNKKQSNEIDNALFRELRNYLSHENYLLKKEGIQINNNGKIILYTFDEFVMIIDELKSILEIFVEFGMRKIVELDGNIKETEKRTEIIKKITEELKKKN